MIESDGESDDEINTKTPNKDKNVFDDTDEEAEDEQNAIMSNYKTPAKKTKTLVKTPVRRSIFDSSIQSKGAPTDTSILEEEIELINKANSSSESIEDDSDFDHEDYVTKNGVKTAHKAEDTNVIVFELEKTAKGAYRGKIADTENFSTNVFFVDNIKKVEENLLNKTTDVALHKSNMALHNKCVLLIKDFHVLGPGPSSLGHTSFLGPSFYKALRPGVGATTPSRMKGKAW